MIYRLFDLNIDIFEKYPGTKKKLEEFLTYDAEFSDISIKITDDEISNERTINPGFDDAYYEMICIFRHIIEEILDFNGIFIHSSVIELNKKGYMFAGVSGTGKSTHTNEWKKYFGKDLRIINGDKPIVRIFDGKIYAYGSAWCGEEGWFENDKTLVLAVCFLKQSKENKIRKFDKKEAFKMLINQVVLPKNSKRKIVHYDLLDKFINHLDFYELECDISENAVLCAYNEICK